MIPAGYLAKKVEARPDWLEAPTVADVFSVAGCISGDFVDYIPLMRHNDFWLFNSIADVKTIACEVMADLIGTTMFYYEVYEKQYDAVAMKWIVISFTEIFPTDVNVPSDKRLEGFDVVSFFANSSPECSPLSCNGLAKTIPVNRHCLLETFDEAVCALEDGRFEGGEPGPYRIFAVYTMPG